MFGNPGDNIKPVGYEGDRGVRRSVNPGVKRETARRGCR
jgi:hypothetical protein